MLLISVIVRDERPPEITLTRDKYSTNMQRRVSICPKELKRTPTKHWNCPIYECQDSGTRWGSDLLKDSYEKAALAAIR